MVELPVVVVPVVGVVVDSGVELPMVVGVVVYLVVVLPMVVVVKLVLVPAVVVLGAAVVALEHLTQHSTLIL